jgi:hypothetical protein
MSTSNDSSTSFRYFLAGLKPLRKATFWIPIGIIALVGLGLWQYRNQTNQANQISPFPLGDKKLLPDAPLLPNAQLPSTQWIGKEPTENTKTVNKNNRIPENSFSSDPTIAPSRSKSGGKIPTDTVVNSLVSDLNPLGGDSSQSGKNNVLDILRQNNRSSTLFAPLLPNRANQNSARSSGLLPEDDPRANNYRVIFPRGFNAPIQTESPLERAVNRESASAPQNFPQPSAYQNSTTARGQGQSQGQGQGQGQTAPSQTSLYSNSYQPPTYQQPGTGANSAGGNNYSGNPNNATANAPAQPPAPGGGGGFQSGF